MRGYGLSINLNPLTPTLSPAGRGSPAVLRWRILPERYSRKKCSASSSLRFAVVALAVVVLTQPAHGESAEDFFKGKQMSLIVGYNPGGSYDVYSRFAAQMLPKYLPGHPTIAVKHMPGVGSVKAANYLFTQAPKDGLTVGMIGQQLALTQALRDPAVSYDVRKFGWLGRFTPIVEVSLTWHTSPTKTIYDAMKRETVMAATSAGATAEQMPSLMNSLAGTKFKMIKGYPGTTGTLLAMERGETEGGHATLANLLFGKEAWLRENKVNVLVQYAQGRHPEFSSVPAMVEFGKSPEDKQVLNLFGSTAEIGRALMTPPDVPPARLALLRRAMAAMLADPAFKAEMDKRNMEFGPMSGDELQKAIGDTLNVSPDVINRAIALNRQ